MHLTALVTLLFLAPMRTVDKLPAVDVTIGGNTATFIIDVDANVIAIAPSVAKRLGLAGEVVRVASLRIGAHELRDVEAIVDPFLDRVKHDGVLGTPAFEGLLLTLDYPGAKVRLARGALEPGDTVFACSPELPQRCAIPITLAGTPRLAILDTAAQRAMLIPREIASSLPLTDRRAGGVALGPQTGTASVEDAVLDAEVGIGAHRVARPAITIHDRPRILIGSGLLSRFVVTFDFANRRVRIE